jgi:hypothetical protein
MKDEIPKHLFAAVRAAILYWISTHTKALQLSGIMHSKHIVANACNGNPY